MATSQTTYLPGGYMVEHFDEGHAVCESYILLPGENLWSSALRATLYFLALAFCFIGVAIISDSFMAAIEVITSKEKTIRKINRQTGHVEEIKVLVWNATVANLSLMALGSSAPEILLSTIETVTSLGEPAGELGAGTIVGSAAFNLLMISSIIVYAIPDGEVRNFTDIGVFGITAVSSVWAYVWLVIVLMVWTPDEVTIIEAVLTFLMFPLLVAVAFAQDQGWWRENPDAQTDVTVTLLSHDDVTKQRIIKDLLSNGRSSAASSPRKRPTGSEGEGEGEGEGDAGGESKQHNTKAMELINLRASHVNNARESLIGGGESDIDELIDDTVGRLMQEQAGTGRSRMMYMINARRGLMGRQRIIADDSKPRASDPHSVQQLLSPNMKFRRSSKPIACEPPTLAFQFSKLSVMEDCGHAEVLVLRSGSLKEECSVLYKTVEGTAFAGDDFEHVSGVLNFASGEDLKVIKIPIVDDDKEEDNETFMVRLDNPYCEDGGKVVLGARRICEIEIVDNDGVGFVELSDVEFYSKDKSLELTVKLVRKNGCCGQQTVMIKSEDGTAKAGVDYMPIDERVTLMAGEVEKKTRIRLVNELRYKEESFFTVKVEPCLDVEGESGFAFVEEDVVKTHTTKNFSSLVNHQSFRVKTDASQKKLGTLQQTSSSNQPTSSPSGSSTVMPESAIKNKNALSPVPGGKSKNAVLVKLMSFDSKTIDISATSNDKNGKDNKGNGADIGQSTGQKNGKNGGDAENNRVSSIVGGINSAKCVVRTDEEVKVVVDNIFAKLKNRFVTVGTTTWGMQFREAMTVGADVDEHGISHPPSNFDYTMHFFSLFWKVLFAFVPPTSYYGGWATFTVALVFIGALTAIIGELASLFGCVIGLKDSVTAITFVALGTSLPDTFASKQAAEECPDADSSVGNITGSNSVNVFLGLGLPWIIASVYNYMNDDPYIFPAGSLGFSVIVFSFTAIVCLGLLVYRQFVSKSVLGGDKTEKTWVAGLFAFLWFVYILLSSMKAYGHIDLF